ncbi:MAG: TraC family protein [Patescibacteria group bacterium]|nr:TraC family protein [Patescibacteria group bacterium]
MQEHLSVAEIKDGIVILKDGSLRAVLAVSSINFDLKSSTEQEAIVYAYQRFLNALDFPLQILITTRKFDIKPYLQMLERRKETEQNQLLRDQIEDYMKFVKELVDISNIMSKLFYIIVPFYVISSKKHGLLARVSASLKPRKEIYHNRERFETYKNQLFQRVEEVKDALSGAGVRMAPLNTQELIEMYYNYYNPSEFEHITVPSLRELNIERS